MNSSDLPARDQGKKISVESAMEWIKEIANSTNSVQDGMMAASVALLISTIQPLRDENVRLRAEISAQKTEYSKARAELARIDKLIGLMSRGY